MLSLPKGTLRPAPVNVSFPVFLTPRTEDSATKHIHVLVLHTVLV